MPRRKKANGEGTITQRKDGRWEARVTLPDGKRKCLYGRTRREVQQKLVATQSDVRRGMPVVSERQTVEQYLAHWLEDVVKPGVRPRTYEAYRLNVRRLLPHIAKERLAGLTPARVQATYAALMERGLSRRTVEQTHTVLHTALRHAMKERLIAFNPTEAVTAPRPERREMQTLSKEQMQRLFGHNEDDRFHALWVLLGTVGLRIGEASGLRWSDIDFSAEQLTVRRALQRQHGKGLVLVEPKTPRSRRTIQLPNVTIEALRRHRVRQAESRLAAGPLWQDSDLVFCTVTGGPLDPARINEAFHRALARADLPRRRVHDLRHSTASTLLALGVPVHVVSAILGHCQASVTLNVYAHVSAGDQADAMRRLNAALTAV